MLHKHHPFCNFMFSLFFRQWIPLAFVISGLAGFGLVLVQQSLRMTANDPQLHLVEEGVARIGEGERPEVIIPQGRIIDPGISDAPFLIVYDEAGRPVASSAELEGSTPAPPAGVFEYARRYGEDRITWQPRSNVRVAIIVRHIAGRTGGFILAGRSLHETERRVGRLTFLTVCALGALLVGSAVIVALMQKQYFFSRKGVI